MSKSNCNARQYSDQMLCRCGLAWDMNDPEPPVCRAADEAPKLDPRVAEKTARHVRNAGVGARALQRIREGLNDARP